MFTSAIFHKKYTALSPLDRIPVEHKVSCVALSFYFKIIIPNAPCTEYSFPRDKINKTNTDTNMSLFRDKSISIYFKWKLVSLIQSTVNKIEQLHLRPIRLFQKIYRIDHHRSFNKIEVIPLGIQFVE